MRILLTTDTIGGVWTFTERLCAALCGGNEVALVSFGRPLSPAQQAWVRGMRTVQSGFFEFFHSDAPLEWMQRNDQTFGEGAEILEQVARSFRPDLLHANQFCWGALAGPLGLPTLITAHSDVLSWASACKPSALADSPWLRRYKDMVQAGLDGAHAVAAPSEWMLHALGTNFHLPRRTEAIANGVTLNEPSAQKQPLRTLQAVTAGRLWDEGKNIALLAGLDLPMPLVIAGEASWDGCSSAFAPRARCVGTLAPDELHRLFRESAIYVCPSLYEPFGLAPLEAALCGCALVLNDIAPLRELWGEAALYFQDADTLRAVLEQLAGDTVLLASAQARCEARALQFPTRRMAAGYRDLYNELIATASLPDLERRLAHAF